MTLGEPKIDPIPDIRSVAVVGCGPSGLASIYELLHTNKDGTSTVGAEIAANPKFTKIVGFEQNHKAGGIWAPSFDEADPPVPPRDIMNTEEYHNPDVIHPRQEPPADLLTASEASPVVAPYDSTAQQIEWNHSGIFRNLFTNIPSRFTRFSYMENDPKYYDKLRTIYPFMTQTELSGRMDTFVDTEGLNKHIRFNSSVQAVTKTHDKWTVTVKKVVDNEEHWYQEVFDAVIIASGHYSIPYYPHIEGLAEFNRNFPGSLIHANSYRTVEPFRDEKVLVIGGSISTINILQYIVRVAKSVTVSSRGNHRIFPWLDKAVRSEGITHRPTVKKIDGNGTVTFDDGSEESRFDIIVFTTGYHFHYPMAEEYLKVINPSNYSRVRGLYYHTFCIEDPTLACVGVAASTVNFQSMENSAAFIAGIWSGAKQLPSKQQQLEWEEKRRELKGDGSSFHYYFDTQITDEFIDPLVPYYAKGRESPLAVDGDHLSDVEVGVKSIEQLFYGVKSGRLTGLVKSLQARD